MLRIPEPPSPSPIAKFARSIPLPRGPQWYLVAYRWLIVAATLYTVTVMWNLWQDRSDPNWHAWKFATPAVSQVTWEHRPSDAELAPMLPVWNWLPQFSIGWLIVGSLLWILIRPRSGLVALCAVLLAGVLMDRTRIQPHAMMVLLIIGTLPGIDAQLIGRTSLIAIWFWAGFHKFIIDFIKPDGMFGFASNVIPMDIVRFFPPEKYTWNTPQLGTAVGWSVAITEMTLGLLCLFPPARWLVAITAVGLHAGVIFWNCLSPRSNLIGWNIVLGLGGLALILPWREWPWVSWKACRPFVRAISIFLLICPAGYYLNWVNAYLSYCVYVPNTPFGVLHRPDENQMAVPFMTYDVVNVPLPPGHSISEAYFEKIKRPGDVMIIHDPRPWAQHNGMNGRQLTDLGEFPRGKYWVYQHPDGAIAMMGGEDADGRKQGLWREWYSNGQSSSFGLMVDGFEQGRWIRWYPNGLRKSEGDYDHGLKIGHWTTWYDNGQKETEGDYNLDQPDGLWSEWTPEGKESRLRWRNGLPLGE